MWKIINSYFSVFLIFSCLTNTVNAEQKTKKIPARANHDAIYIEENKQMLIYGGYGSVGVFSDLWIIDLDGEKKWERISAANKGPSVRNKNSFAYDSHQKQIIVFGGKGTRTWFSDTWIYDVDKKTWENIKTEETPYPRAFHSAVYDSFGKQMLVFGGAGEPRWNLLFDTWVFNLEKMTWKMIDTEEKPSARCGHCAIYIKAVREMIVFGGNSKTGYCDDLWIFDIGKNKWKEIVTEESPIGRENFTAVYDETSRQMFIFGGKGREGMLSDVWVFDMDKKSWKEIASADETPVARSGHSAVYDSSQKQMIIFGGAGKRDVFSDIWSFDTEKNTWKEIHLTNE